MARRAASLRVPAPRTSCRVCALPHPSSASRQKYSPPGNNLSTGFILTEVPIPRFSEVQSSKKSSKNLINLERNSQSGKKKYLSKICQDANRIKVRINGIKRSARERETSVIGALQHIEHHFLKNL